MPDTATASPLTGPGALFSEDVGEFREELKSRGLLDAYRQHARTMVDTDLWRQQVAEDLFLGDLGAPKKAIQNGEARIWFAAQHNLDPTNDDEVRGKMRGLATVESRRRNVAEGFYRRGFAARLSGGDAETRIGESLNLLADLPEEDRAIARRAFSMGKRQAGDDFGSVEKPARDAVAVLRHYAGEETEAAGGIGPDIENQLFGWYRDAPRSERDKWRQAVAMIAKEEEQWKPGYLKRVTQRMERVFGKFLAEWGGKISRTGENISEKISDTIPLVGDVEEAFEDQRAYFEMRSDLWRALDQDVARLYEDKPGMRKGLESFMESLPTFTAPFVYSPVAGALNAFAVIDQKNYNELRSQYPDLPLDRIEAIARNSAAAESAIELMQFGVLGWFGKTLKSTFGGMPGIKQAMEAGGAAGLARRGLRAGGAAGLFTGAEWVQETAQDMLQPIFTALEEKLGGEIEGFDFEKDWAGIWENNWTRFWAVLPMTLIGGAGRAIASYATNQQIRETMLSWNFMGESGLDRASAEKAMDIARVDPLGAAGFAHRELSALTPDQRQSNRDTVMRDVMREQAERTESPRVLQTREGWELMLPGEQTLRTKDLNEVEAAVQDWILEDASGDMAEIREMLQLQREFSEGASQELLEEVRASRQGGDENIEIVPQEKTSEQGAVSETRRRIAEAQLGLEEGSMGGTVRILGESWVEESQGRAMAMIRLYKGANPLTVIEEGAEGYAKLNAMKDPARRQWLADNLLAAQRDMIERGTIKREFLTEEATKDDEALIEGFSEFVTAYVAGNVNEAALSEGFRAWLARFFKLIRDMLRLVKGVQDLREQGMLDEGFEDFIRRAAGMDVDARNAEIEREALRELERQAEAMEYLQGEAEMLLAEEVERRQEVEADLEARDSGRITYSITPAQDRAYLAAVEQGDMETAQRMVDEAARKAGHKVEAWHVTNARFNKFDPEKASMGGVFWFTENKAKIDANETGAGLRPGEPKEVIHAYLKTDNPAGWSEYDQLGLGQIEGRGFDSIKLDDDWVIFNPSQIKSADPVTYDDAGNVVPLSERFNESDPRITHSIAPQSPVLTALQERIRRGDEAVVPFFEKMQERVIDIRDRFTARDDGSGELDLRTALAYLGAIQRTLPRELAKVAGTATRLSDFKTLEAMEREIARRIPRIELAFEKFFQKTYRLKVRKLIDKSAAKMDKLTRRKSPKVDVVGSAIIDQAVAAMTMSPEEANALADAKRQEADTGDLSAEDQEIRYGEALALELFADYVNASSSRLRSAIEFLETNYEEGRAARLEELARRKAEKEERIERMLSSLGTGPVKSYLETAFYDQAPKWFKTLPRELQSFYQVTDMLMENAKTPEDRAVVAEMQNAFRRAAMQFEDRAEEMGEEVEGVIGRLWGFNPKGLRGEASLKALLRDLSTERPNAVTYLEGRKFEEVKVPKAAVDALLRREVNSFEVKGETVELTESDLGELEKAVELFEELPERSQNSRKYITFERVTAEGERTPIGPQSQLDMLKDWLALGQVDAREKYENVGFDETYARELEDALDPQVIELGKWLRDRLKKLTPEVDVAHRREYGLRLASIENYFPLVFQHARNQEEISMDGYDMKRPSQGSWLKARVTHRALPRKANALAVFHAHTQQSLFWLTHAQVIREWGGVMRSMDMQNAVKKRLGVETQQALNKWLNLVEYQGQNQAVLSLGWDRAISNIQSGMSLAVLGGRVRTLLFNANAMFNVLLRVPIGDVLRGFKGLNLADMRKVISSPTFQRRLKSGGSYAAKVALEARSTGGYVPSLLRGAAERGVQPINIVDTLTNLTVAGAYRARLVDLRKQFPSRTDQELEERALDYVDDIMARVAQPVNYLSRSLYENANRRGPAALMFLFASEMRKNFSTLFLAGRKLITGKGEQSKALAAQQAIVILAVYATFTHIMKSLYDAFFRDPDDEEDEFASALDKALDPAAWANSMATEHLRGLPVFGEGASYFIGKAFGQQVYNRSNNPMIRAVEAWQKGERLLEAETVGEAVDLTIDTIQSAASLFPETAVFSQAGNITEEGLGFFRHTFDASLTKADAMERRASRLRKRKKEIAEPTAEEKRKLLDLDDRTRTQNARLKAIDSDRNSQIAGYIQETLAEMALDDRLDYLKFLKEKRLLNEDVARELGYHRELGYSNR